MLSVGIDTRPLFFTRGGIASYLSGLISALFRVAPEVRYALLCPRRVSGPDLGVTAPETAWRVLRLPLRNRALERIWENLLLPPAVWKDRLDLVHFPRFAVPAVRAGRAVVTIHDLAFRRCPDTLTSRGRRYFEAAAAKAVRRADAIIAVSEHTRQDLLDSYPIPPDRVHVVHNGVAPHFHLGDRDAARRRIRLST